MRDQLYRKPIQLKSHTNESGSFFGALGFTVPVEELTVRMASLTDILCWLTQPQGPHLVDDTSAQDSFMALAILVTPQALYDADSPQVRLGLVYKPPYIQAASFSETYFSLKSASQAEVGNRLTTALVTFVQIHESSQVIPLPGVPALFLDMKTEEDITNFNDPWPPQDFRGFRVHKVLYLGGGMTTGLVAIPHLQGMTLFHWTSVQKQVLPPELERVAQLTVTLSLADSDHWNLRNDIVFPDCLAKFKARHEASLASKATMATKKRGGQGGGPVSTPKLPPPPPPPSSLGWEEVDKKVTEIMDQLHNLHLETMQEMGFIRAIDQAMAKSIMVEFLRLNLITTDDLKTILRAWHADLEVSTGKLLRDLDLAAQTCTTLPSKNTAIEVALDNYRELAKLKLALPLAQLDTAYEEIEKFMQHRIKELQSQQETKHLVVELSSRITAHHNRVCQVLRSEPLRHAEVARLVLVGMAANRPLESNFFPGLLEGLLGRLGIAMPGESKPPTSSHEGAGCLWSSAIHKAVLQREHREVETPRTAGLPQCLNLNYGDFLEKQSHQVLVAFSDPLFVPSMANAMYEAFKPPVLSRASPFAGGCREPSTLGQPGDGDPKLEMPKPERPEPMESGALQEAGSTGPSASLASQQVQDPAPEVSDTDSSKTGEHTPEEEWPHWGPKVKVIHQLRKHGHKVAVGDPQDGASPSKVRKEMEAEDADTPAPTGPSEATLRTVQFELNNKDSPKVKEVRARILGLEEGEAAIQENFDSSPDFQLRWAADETRQPKVISEHWIDYLDREGHLAECKPRDFKFGEGWLPLYTRASVTKQISSLSTLLSSQGDSPLIAVIPQTSFSVQVGVCNSPAPQVRVPVLNVCLFRQKPTETDSILPLLWSNEQELHHSLQPREEAPRYYLSLWRLLWQTL